MYIVFDQERLIEGMISQKPDVVSRIKLLLYPVIEKLYFCYTLFAVCDEALQHV